MRSPDVLAAEIRSLGLKMTPQRTLLFSLLHQDESHPSADELFERATAVMPGISLRTVYQTLGDLVEMGELRAVQVAGGATRFDPNMGDHHHAVCERCGTVRDVYLTGADDLNPDHSLDGFTIRVADIVLRGLCRRCVEIADG